MRRYFSKEDFLCFLNLLEENKSTELFTECLEDNSIHTYKFMKINFNDNIIILHDNPYCCIGIIQDTPVASLRDYSEGVWESLIQENEYKVFIEAD